MKTLFILCLCSIAFTYAIAQKAILQTDVQRMNLRGQVKSIRSIKYEAKMKAGKAEGWEIFWMDADNNLVEFDMHGNIIKETTYKNNGSINYTIFKSWFKPGLIKEFIMYETTALINEKDQDAFKDAISQREIYSYDINDFITKRTYYTKNKITTVRNYTHKFITPLDLEYQVAEKNVDFDNRNWREGNVYNKDKTLKTIIYQKGNPQVSTLEHQYDNKKRLVHQTKYYSEQIEWEYLFEYDSNGNQIKVESLSPSLQNTKTFEYKFDEKGNATEIIETLIEKTGGRKYQYRTDITIVYY